MTVQANFLVGDVRERLREIAPKTVQTCITSPPYWGLRDYGVAGQIGSEKTPDEFIATMVDVFRLVRETLRDDGTLWVNLGDSYSVNGNQMLMPHRVAMAMQADGWILRSTVVWAKRSPMPESISGWRWVQCRVKIAGVGKVHPNYGGNGVLRNMTDRVETWQPCPGCKKCEPNGGLILRKGSWRPTTAHEYVFLFSKTNDYYADGDAVAELAVCGDRGSGHDLDKTGSRDGGERSQKGPRESRTRGYFVGAKNQEPGKEPFRAVTETRNPRSVWTLSHEPYKQAHFATYPSELVRRMLLATTPVECCGQCGAGYAPVVVKERIPTREGTNAIPVGNSGANRDPQRHIQRTVIQGYRPACRCNAPAGRSLVLDPFAGSGTTLQVARHYGRDSVGIELSETYAAMARERIAKTPRCAISKNSKVAKLKINARQKVLF